MDEVAGDDVGAAGRPGEVDACHTHRRRGRCVGERMHGVLRHGLARRGGGITDAKHRLRGRRDCVPARGGKIADGVAGDGVDAGGGDDAANLSGGGGAVVVVIEIDHGVTRDARAAGAGTENARDLLGGAGSGRGSGVEAVRRGGAAHGVVADGVRPRCYRDADERGGDSCARAVHRDGADGVVGDGHRTAAPRDDAEAGAARSRGGDGDGTCARAAADGVARHRADVDIARLHINPGPDAGQRGGVAAARPDHVRDGIPLHAAGGGGADIQQDTLEQKRRRGPRGVQADPPALAAVPPMKLPVTVKLLPDVC